MKTRFQRVSVVGLGYIGLPVAALLASRGLEVIGVDLNPLAVRAINEGLSKVDSLRTGKEGNAKAALDQLEAVAAQVEADGKSKTGVDGRRYAALAETLRGRAARLR